MSRIYLLFFYLGALFLFLFAFWYVLPTDHVTAVYIGEAASSVFCAAGLTFIYIGFRLKQELANLQSKMLEEARLEAQEAVQTQIDMLTEELNAARDYIAKINAQNKNHDSGSWSEHLG